MREWDASKFEAALGRKVNWGVVYGREHSGKAELAKALAGLIKGKIINMGKIAEDLKKKLGTEDEPFEGDVPTSKIEEAILETVAQDRAANRNFTYIFEDWAHKNATEFINAINAELGLPSLAVHCTADKRTIEDRYKKANETEEIGEDAQAELDDAAKKDNEAHMDIEALFEEANIKSCLSSIVCESHETAVKSLKDKFSAKVLFVNHDKRLNVDTVCSNLAIKYDMLYLSVYQMIKFTIQSGHALGKELKASKRVKQMTEDAKPLEGMEDPFEEAEYSAVHYDSKVVMKMIQAVLAEKRTS